MHFGRLDPFLYYRLAKEIVKWNKIKRGFLCPKCKNFYPGFTWKVKDENGYPRAEGAICHFCLTVFHQSPYYYEVSVLNKEVYASPETYWGKEATEEEKKEVEKKYGWKWRTEDFQL